MSGKSALLIGATGALGKHVLRELISSTEFSRVLKAGRRVTPLDQLPPSAKDKLEQKTVDFEKINEAGLREGKWDVIFITLGAKISSPAFEKIDREYVLNSAQAAKVDGHEQRIVHVSTYGANANSRFLYSRSKGLTENGLAELNYSDTIIFRPVFLANPERSSTGIMESIAAPLFGAASHLFSSAQIDVALLGKSIVRSGFLGSAKLPAVAEAETKTTPGGAQFTTIGTRGAVKLGNASLL